MKQEILAESFLLVPTQLTLNSTFIPSRWGTKRSETLFNDCHQLATVLEKPDRDISSELEEIRLQS